MSGARVFVLDDDPSVRGVLVEALEGAGMAVRAFGRADAFEAALRGGMPDVCLVDLGLPDRDGLGVVARLALEGGASVIIVSGRGEVADRVAGLELGADDYVVKPVAPEEIVARVRARVRRAVPGARRVAAFEGWEADFDGHFLTTPGGDAVPFGQAEGAVLRLFLERPRRLVSRADMQDALGASAGEAFDRAMDVRVSRLRAKLGDDPKDPRLLKTVYGAGYIFLGAVAWR